MTNGTPGDGPGPARLGGDVSTKIKVYAIIFDWKKYYLLYKGLIESGAIPFHEVLLVKTEESIDQMVESIGSIDSIIIIEVKNYRWRDLHNYDYYNNFFPTYKIVTKDIIAGTISVSADSFREFRFMIPEKACIYGDFRASGGLCNDIIVLILDDIAFADWEKYGFVVNAYYNSERTMAGQIRVELPPGIYHLLYSNKFSTFLNKSIKTKISYEYETVIYGDQ